MADMPPLIPPRSYVPFVAGQPPPQAARAAVNLEVAQARRAETLRAQREAAVKVALERGGYATIQRAEKVVMLARIAAEGRAADGDKAEGGVDASDGAAALAAAEDHIATQT